MTLKDSTMSHFHMVEPPAVRSGHANSYVLPQQYRLNIYTV